jgi:hypothetical protein
MPVTNTPIFPQALLNTGLPIGTGTGLVQFTVGTSTATGTKSDFLVAGANGAIITAIMVQNTDTATNTMALLYGTGGVISLLGVAAISGAGTATTYSVPPTNLLNGTQGVIGLPFDSCGNRILYVPPGGTLSVGLLSTIIFAHGFLFVNAIGGNF